MSHAISLPIYKPDTLDNSQIETHGRCPRLYLYRYLMRRGPAGKSYPIQFGLAYHTYREVIEKIMLENKVTLSEEIHLEGMAEAFVDFENPPLEHRHSFLNTGRLVESLELARDRVRLEQKRGRIKVMRAEDAFDLRLPHEGLCPYCHEEVDFDADLDECPHCGEPFPRFGGRMDQIINWSSKIWIRDFKTTSRLGNTYSDQFDPNNQMSGYVWAAGELSGRQVKGALIEVLYNTKNKGPEFHQFTSTRSPGQLRAWMATIFSETRDIRRNIANIPYAGYHAFPQRTSACSDYGGCYFRGSAMSVGPCSMQSSREIEMWLESNTIYSHWDFTDPNKEESKA